MATDINFATGQPSASENRQIKTVGSYGNTVAFATPWLKMVETEITAQVNGTATACVAVVQRSSTDPAGEYGAQTAPADADGFDGNLATGIPGNIYKEAGAGWWRINVTTVTGGTAAATISGKGGKSA